ncbi:developmental pluripotency-associated 5 protein-like [Sapajus apella]|uniref:Embryonal stem cell-specific gene 1 protein n=1 Tax=Sapajus apella TaxID=9515 RepID=A0A6J3HMB6_SAPAP|nr:developmental pluripotency-associated 5 protein-like [Sapajus apella]
MAVLGSQGVTSFHGKYRIPPWVKVPEDLKDPEVFQVPTRLLEAIFGREGCRIPYIEQVSKAMLKLKALESPHFTKVVVYGSYIYKLRAKWMLQSVAERHCQHQERGMLKLEETMNALELGPWMKPASSQDEGQDVEISLWPELE